MFEDYIKQNYSFPIGCESIHSIYNGITYFINDKKIYQYNPSSQIETLIFKLYRCEKIVAIDSLGYYMIIDTCDNRRILISLIDKIVISDFDDLTLKCYFDIKSEFILFISSDFKINYPELNIIEIFNIKKLRGEKCKYNIANNEIKHRNNCNYFYLENDSIILYEDNIIYIYLGSISYYFKRLNSYSYLEIITSSKCIKYRIIKNFEIIDNDKYFISNIKLENSNKIYLNNNLKLNIVDYFKKSVDKKDDIYVSIYGEFIKSDRFFYHYNYNKLFNSF